LRAISFLSDYGHRDEWVGVCHGVINRIAPGASVIDIAHDVPATNVPHAAFVPGRSNLRRSGAARLVTAPSITHH